MLLETIIAWLIMTLMLVGGYGWAAWLLGNSAQENRRLLEGLLTLVLSAGGLTLVMLWIGLFGAALNFGTIAFVFAAVMLPGWWLWGRSKNKLSTQHEPSAAPVKLQNRWQWVALMLITAVCGAVLFNAVYWPFSGDDARLYYWYGIVIRDGQAIAPLNGANTLHEAYPMLLQFLYSFSLMISSWRDEYLARFVAAMLSLACLPTVYLLGKALYGRLAGWLSMLLLALTPTVANWASEGYADLPAAAFYTLATFFAWRLFEKANWRHALLCGVMIGLAAWTKNTALIGIPLLGLWLIYGWLRRRIALRHVLICGAACAGVAAVWYLRNVFEAGLIIPPTAWTEQAAHTLNSLLVFITRPEQYAFTGMSILLAVGTAGLDLLRRTAHANAAALLLLMTLPYFGVWWWFASYDPRFLLMILPLLTVLSGGLLARIWGMLPIAWRSRVRWAAAILAAALAVFIMWDSIEYKTELLRDPLMSHERKIEVVRNGERILPNLVSQP